MAKEEAKPVRYQVLAPVFVNGSLVEPIRGKPVYVVAAPGLEGRALRLAPEGPAPKEAGAGKGGTGPTP